MSTNTNATICPPGRAGGEDALPPSLVDIDAAAIDTVPLSFPDISPLPKRDTRLRVLLKVLVRYYRF